MTLETLTAIAVFAFVTSITPGPNNLMLMASGANFGIHRSLPHMFGVALGFVLMLVLVGTGLSQIFTALPWAERVLQVVSILYMLFLAWKIANAAPPSDAAAQGTPMTFLQAALFQWVNPKAWTMALTAMAAYAPSQSLNAVFGVALIFGMVNLPSIAVWTSLGVQVRALLVNPSRLMAFNLTMAFLLILSLYPVLFPA